MHTIERTVSTDVGLIKHVYDETYMGQHIMASINRFGSLSVFVWDDENHIALWQGENILAARMWCRNHANKPR